MRKTLLVLNAVALIACPGSGGLDAWAAVVRAQSVPVQVAPGGVGAIGAAPSRGLGPAGLQLDLRLGGMPLSQAPGVTPHAAPSAAMPAPQASPLPSLSAPGHAVSLPRALHAAPVSQAAPASALPALRAEPLIQAAPAASLPRAIHAAALPQTAPAAGAAAASRATLRDAARGAIPKLDLADFAAESLSRMPAAGARAAGAALMDRVLRERGAGNGDLAEPSATQSAMGSRPALLGRAPAAASPSQGAEVPAAKPAAPARASWDVWTVRMVYLAGFVFSLLLVPQIAKNFVNLGAGEFQALAALPWLGFATNVLANSLYLGRFREKKENSRALIQLIGVLSGTVVLTQLLMAGFMPPAAFTAVAALVVADLGINLLAYLGKLPGRVWNGWSEAMGLLGLALIPQALWSTFVPGAAASAAPLAASAVAVLALYALKRFGILPGPVNKAWQALAGLTGTLLFMFGPVAALVAMAAHPADIAGIALGSVLLGLTGDLLLTPRLLLTKDGMGLTSNLWSVVLAGLARLVWMYACGFVPAFLFWPVVAAVPAFFAFAALMGRRHPAAPADPA